MSAAPKAASARSISRSLTTSGGIQRSVRAVGAGVHQDEVTFVEAVLGDGRDAGGIVELGAHHQAETAHLGDDAVLLLQLADAGLQLLAAGDHVGEERRVRHDLDGGERGRAPHRVAAVRAAVAAGGPLVVELAAGAERGEREAAGDALGHADDVGLDAVVIDGEHLAGAAEAALHLVGDEQDAVLRGSARRCRG